jgi:2-dehydro-3-deoxyphosphogluconate aldolase/(4S)-4-hydroxy-2-oxoglutarate aldolase
MHDKLFGNIHDIGLIPVLRIYEPSKAVSLAGALVRGEIPCATITYCLKTAKSAISQILKAYPHMIIGCSTVLTALAAEEAVKAGAQFIMTQGFNTEVITWCLDNNVPVIPGVNNQETILKAIELGLTTLNFFPCEIAGGAQILRRFAIQYPQVKFLPSGGITEENLSSYARQANVLAAICPWVSNDEWVEAEAWEHIELACRQSRLAIQGLAISHMGIVSQTKMEAEKTIKGLEAFGMLAYPGKTSTFMETDLEILESNPEENPGHLTFKCYDVERTLAYLLTKGFTPDTTSATVDMNGKTKTVCLNEDIGGFTIHLTRA